MARLVGIALILMLAGPVQAQSEEARRITQSPLNTQSSMRLLHLTQSGDRATKLFLLDKWGDIGNDAAKHWHRINKVRQWSSRHLKFPGLLSKAIFEIASGQDEELGLAATITLAKLSRPQRPVPEGEELRCGVVARPGGVHATPYLRQLGERHRKRLISVASDQDIHAFEGVIEALFACDPNLAISLTESRLAAAKPEDKVWLIHRYAQFLREEKNYRKLQNLAEDLGSDHSGTFLLLTTAESIAAYGRELKRWPTVLKWALIREYQPPSEIINQLLVDPDPALRARAALKWRPSLATDLAIQRELAKIDLKSPLTRCFYPDLFRLGSYSHLIELAKSGSPMFLSMVIAEAKNSAEFEFAISRLGQRAIDEANGAEGAALYDHWPTSKPHLEQMLSGERYVSRYVAAYVLLQLPDDKFSRQEKKALIHRIAFDKDPIVPNVLLEGYRLPSPDLFQETLIEMVHSKANPEYLLHILDRVGQVQEWIPFLTLCSQNDHPQVREYAIELLKQRYR